MRTSALSLSILLTASLSWGQALRGQEGNGGDVLVCQETGGLTYKFFDLHEGMKLKIPYSLGDKNLSVRDKVAMFMSRLETISPNRMKEYNARAQLLLADIEEFQAGYPDWKRKKDPEDVYLTNTHFSIDPLMDIPDTGRTTYPENCQVKQLVIQATPKIKTDRLFQIHISLFEKLDNDSIAMMVSHESIIPEGYANSHPDTRMSRFMNVTIASDALKDMTDKQWFEHLKTVGYKYLEKDGVLVSVALEATFDEDGRIRFSELGEWYIPLKEGDKVIQSFYPANVRYDENGKKLAFTFKAKDQQYYYSSYWSLKDAVGTDFFAGHSFGFHANGNTRYFRPIRTSSYGEKDYIVKFQGRNVKLNAKHWLSIFLSPEGETVGYSNAHDNEGGSVFAMNLPPEEYSMETSIDKFVDDANLPRPYILRLVNPTFRGKPLLLTDDGWYKSYVESHNICSALGFGEKLNVSHLSMDGGEAYRYRPKTEEKPAEWELVEFKNSNPISGFLYAHKDGLVAKELICVK